MEKYLIISIILIIASFVYLKLAIKYNILDKPNHRSSHKKITVRGGGIIFTVSVLLFFLLNEFQYPFFFLGIIIISIVSFLDDIYTLSSKIRVPYQLLAIALAMYQIGFSFIPLYTYLFALIIGFGIINMFNFMDGINGITGMYSLSVVLGLYAINYDQQIVNPDLIVYCSISLLIFGFYNFRKKALFFAGDIGSIAIGVIVFFIGMYLTIYLKSPLILLLIIVYGADVGNTVLYRKFYTNENIFDAHRHHIYQKLVDVKKKSHIKVSLMYAVTQSVINIIVYKSYLLDIQIQYMIFVTLVTLFMFAYVYLFRKLKA